MAGLRLRFDDMVEPIIALRKRRGKGLSSRRESRRGTVGYAAAVLPAAC